MAGKASERFVWAVGTLQEPGAAGIHVSQSVRAGGPFGRPRRRAAKLHSALRAGCI
jgi:hypothetical protein